MARVLTGDRPTGRLHLGHYVGSLARRLELQREHELFNVIADYHALTTRPKTAGQLAQYSDEIVLDYLGVGLDPARVRIYRQSDLPETLELFVLLSMLVTVPRVSRIPTLKEMLQQLQIEQPSLGLLSYPVLQAADILIVRAERVPVGADQAAHLELARELARRFNGDYAEVFPIPEPLLSETVLVGTDGRGKMSKSLDNAIFLSDRPDVVTEKVLRMYTDPTRVHPTDPGHVEGNPVFVYHEHFNSDRAEVEDLKQRYRRGAVGDVEVKRRLAEALNRFLDPVRARRARYEGQADFLRSVLDDGAAAARREARRTLAQVRRALRM
jgi:tryptophanyl-tRNA synthetase